MFGRKPDHHGDSPPNEFSVYSTRGSSSTPSAIVYCRPILEIRRCTNSAYFFCAAAGDVFSFSAFHALNLAFPYMITYNRLALSLPKGLLDQSWAIGWRKQGETYSEIKSPRFRNFLDIFLSGSFEQGVELFRGGYYQCILNGDGWNPDSLPRAFPHLMVLYWALRRRHRLSRIVEIVWLKTWLDRYRRKVTGGSNNQAVVQAIYTIYSVSDRYIGVYVKRKEWMSWWVGGEWGVGLW